jgi:putative CocE/NonD family hydrolase
MPTRRTFAPLVLGLFALAVPRAATAQGLDYVRANYTKYEYRIPMRDGVRLFTSVYVPKDASKPHPIVMTRTPYSVGPYGIDVYRENLGPSPRFGRSGYIVAYQDVRGRYMSEGTFVDVRPQIPEKKGPSDIDESSDTFDTIDWLVKNVPNNNGKVGIWGISYPGFYAAAGMVDAHPALKAASPQAPLVDWFLGDDFHHNGAFFLHQCFNFYADFGVPRPEPTSKKVTPFEHGTPDPYEFFLRMGPLPRADDRYFHGQRAFWSQLMEHGTYDEFWKKRALWPHFKGVRPAVQTVGGWFDAEDLYGPLKTYRTVEENGPKSQNTIVMGPWVHGGWSGGDGDSLGAVRFASKTGEFFRDTIQFPFFEFHLRGETGSDPQLVKFEDGHPRWNPPKAWVFETGRNEWHRSDAWPPKEARAKTIYFRDGGKLAVEPPAQAEADEFDEFPSDPGKPVPYTATIGEDYPPDFMVEDQRFTARRPDVLVYQTEPLTEDLRLAGPIEAKLHVSTSGTDSDWVVKLIDVYPDDHPDPSPNPKGVKLGGYQQLVRWDVFRGRFRAGFEKPEPFKPGEPTVVPMAIPDVHHTFRPGHRLMVQVQCSLFPLVDRNPQTFVDIYHARESDFRKATQRVYRSSERPTRLEVRVLP